MNSIEYMKLAAFEELKEALKTKRIHDELLEYLASSLRYIIYYTNKYNIPIPEREKIIELMNKAMIIEDKLPPTRNQHDFKHVDDSTEPKIFKILSIYQLFLHNILTIQAYLNCLTKKNLDYIYLGKEIIVTIKDIRKDENNSNCSRTKSESNSLSY